MTIRWNQTKTTASPNHHSVKQLKDKDIDQIAKNDYNNNDNINCNNDNNDDIVVVDHTVVLFVVFDHTVLHIVVADHTDVD